MITNMLALTITIIWCFVAPGVSLILAYKAMQRVDFLEMQLGVLREDIAKLGIVDKALHGDISAVMSLVRATSNDLTSTQVGLNKRIRKLEQKDGQIQNWINITVDCFESQQDQLDTMSKQVFKEPAGEKE